MTTSALLWTVIKIAVIVGFVFNVAGLLTWYDRRGGAMMQDRIGPNRAGIKIGKFELRVAGLLHTAADGVKFFTKKDFMPPKADKLLFSLAPMLAMIPVLVLLAVIPFGGVLRPELLSSSFQAMEVPLVVAPLNIGILFVFAMAGQGIVGAAIAGWSSDNKFSLMGALRAASQMVSYEVTMGLTLIGCMMVYGSVRLDEMARWQSENTWGIFIQPVAFVLFFTAAIAESKRIPFDLPEAESELVSGYFTEYSGMKFGMFYFAEYMEVVTSSMLLVTLFLGGWHLPFVRPEGLHIVLGENEILTAPMSHGLVIGIGVVAFFVKTLFLCWIQAFVRWSLPRFRYDQLMKLGWTVLLPASLANIFVTGVVCLALPQDNPEVNAALKWTCDFTQAIVAFVITAAFVRLFVGMFRKRPLRATILGSSARLAAAAGGTKEAPIRA